MNRKDKIHQLLNETADELLEFIKESESEFPDRWVPAAVIKNTLNLNMIMVPLGNENQNEKGWVFAALARILEDKNLVEYKKEHGNAFYRSK